MYQRRDQEKRALCREHGIRLLVVPYWWDKSSLSLAASLRELLPTVALPENIHQVLENGTVTPIGTSDPSDPKLPQRSTLDVWPSNQDPTGALVCNRPGGVHVRWLGSDQQLSSRFGRVIHTPSWWADLMPKADVEGELLLEGGGSVGRLIGSLFLPQGSSSEAVDDVWKKIQFRAVDVVSSSMTLAERVKQLALLPPSGAFAAVDYVECKGRPHLDELLDRCGEPGLLVRSPTSYYRGGAPLGPRLRQVQQATMLMSGPSNTWRFVTAQNLANGALQAVRCSEAQWKSLPPARSLLTVGHFGQWSSGRFRMPFLMHAQEGAGSS